MCKRSEYNAKVTGLDTKVVLNLLSIPTHQGTCYIEPLNWQWLNSAVGEVAENILEFQDDVWKAIQSS